MWPYGGDVGPLATSWWPGWVLVVGDEPGVGDEGAQHRHQLLAVLGTEVDLVQVRAQPDPDRFHVLGGAVQVVDDDDALDAGHGSVPIGWLGSTGTQVRRCRRGPRGRTR